MQEYPIPMKETLDIGLVPAISLVESVQQMLAFVSEWSDCTRHKVLQTTTLYRGARNRLG